MALKFIIYYDLVSKISSLAILPFNLQFDPYFKQHIDLSRKMKVKRTIQFLIFEESYEQNQFQMNEKDQN